jgi:hypothetical protein
LIAFFVPLDGGAVCAVASEGRTKASAAAVKKASVVQGSVFRGVDLQDVDLQGIVA